MKGKEIVPVPSNWVLSDPDSFLIFRKHDEDHFEFYRIAGQKSHIICHSYVDVNDCDIPEICEGFGYETIDQIKEEYGDEWKQYVAECHFWLNSPNHNIVCNTDTWEQAAEMIHRISGYMNSDKASRLGTLLHNAIGELLENAPDDYQEDLLDVLGTDDDELRRLGIQWP